MINDNLKVPFPIDDEQSVIWRYMDFTKFVSLLDKKSLFLCRADKLSDSFEGALTEPDINTRKKEYFTEKYINGKMGIEKINQDLQKISEANKALRELFYINSWYMKENESVAMWSLYAQTNEAIAIKSTVKHLMESLAEYNKLIIGKMKYIDYSKEHIEDKPFVDRFFYKRKSFEHEEEARVVLFNQNEEWDSRLQADGVDGGVYVKIQIDMLIDEIYVAPSAPKWFYELVENVTKHYGINKNVKRTSLDDEALY